MHHSLLIIGLIASLSFVISLPPLKADRPQASKESLIENSTMIATGTVKQVYSTTEKTQNYQTTRYVAEVAVTACEKGERKPGDLIYARFYHATWIGKGSPPPGYSGIRPQPQKGQTVRLYLTTEWNESLEQESDGGLNIVGPNGVEILKSP